GAVPQRWRAARPWRARPAAWAAAGALALAPRACGGEAAASSAERLPPGCSSPEAAELLAHARRHCEDSRCAINKDRAPGRLPLRLAALPAGVARRPSIRIRGVRRGRGLGGGGDAAPGLRPAGGRGPAPSHGPHGLGGRRQAPSLGGAGGPLLRPLPRPVPRLPPRAVQQPVRPSGRGWCEPLLSWRFVGGEFLGRRSAMLDRSVVFLLLSVHTSGIPVGTRFWMGPHREYRGASFVLTAKESGTFYFWSESNASRDGGFQSAYSDNTLGTMRYNGNNLVTYSMAVTGGATVSIDLATAEFVGGFAWASAQAPAPALAPTSGRQDLNGGRRFRGNASRRPARGGSEMEEGLLRRRWDFSEALAPSERFSTPYLPFIA
ncbi:unnamed protein product, partial [Prorocentrum cordatum]